MSGKIRLKISSAVAALIRPDVGGEVKLQAVGTADGFSPPERVTLLFCLMRDSDSTVKVAASAAFAALSDELLLACVATPGIHPAILDTIARIHHARSAVAAALLECPELSPAAADFLSRNALVSPMPLEGGGEMAAGDAAADVAVGAASPEECMAEDEEGFLSKYQMLQRMGISEKIKMALTGDKEWRAILVNDSNKLVSGSVIKNPRISEAEILQFLKVGVQNDEIVRLICANKEWVKNCQIRKALVDCPKTPLPNALRFLMTLGEKDIAAYAKSKNISSVLSTQAKRIMLAKKK
ncbi:hypothetical protein [Pelobacter propionicus]|uniref:Uncharacterized protein n=1 Tax=Pelobacter propionicus (strain DSM 2379 / NBRC 103807 / OttBd1) TaxID=338966 RepID=A1ALR9_PELPD|nr:hypothetical protein [Pelobacter propionicus]ABK98289.1 conserved hypothetical protein [Pelobacter propionicus DSM 2379]